MHFVDASDIHASDIHAFTYCVQAPPLAEAQHIKLSDVLEICDQKNI